MRNAILALVVAIIGGLIVLTVEYNYFNPKVISPAQSSSAPSTSTDIQPNQHTSENSPKDVVAQPTEVNSALADLHKTAKSLSSSYNRDLELTRLVDYAVSKGDIQYAVLIAQDLSSSYNRDLALGGLVEKSIALNRFEVAATAAKIMSSSYNRDLYLSRVLKARREYDERPNPGVQPTPKSGRG